MDRKKIEPIKSHRVKQILKYRRFMSKKRLASLNSDDKKELRQIATGEIPQISRRGRINAMTALSRIGSSKEARILSTIIKDQQGHSVYQFGVAPNKKIYPIDSEVVEIIPEFPSWIIMPLFFVALLVIILYRKRMRNGVNVE